MEIDQAVGVKHDLLALVRMCQIIGDSEQQALQFQALSCPEISMQRLLVDGGYVTEEILTSLEIGQSLVETGQIKETQFCVAMFDEITTGMNMADSLKLRGWLPSAWTPDAWISGDNTPGASLS